MWTAANKRLTIAELHWKGWLLAIRGTRPSYIQPSHWITTKRFTRIFYSVATIQNLRECAEQSNGSRRTKRIPECNGRGSDDGARLSTAHRQSNWWYGHHNHIGRTAANATAASAIEQVWQSIQHLPGGTTTRHWLTSDGSFLRLCCVDIFGRWRFFLCKINGAIKYTIVKLHDDILSIYMWTFTDCLGKQTALLHTTYMPNAHHYKNHTQTHIFLISFDLILCFWFGNSAADCHFNDVFILFIYL